MTRLIKPPMKDEIADKDEKALLRNQNDMLMREIANLRERVQIGEDLLSIANNRLSSVQQSLTDAELSVLAMRRQLSAPTPVPAPGQVVTNMETIDG